MKLSKVICKKKEEIRWLLSKNKLTDVLLCLANDRSPDIVKYYKLNANWHTKCETYCMRKWLFIFRGIWNPIEVSFAMLCYVPVGTRMSITVHACVHVHVHVWQLPAGCQLADGQSSKLPARWDSDCGLHPWPTINLNIERNNPWW